MVLTTVTSCVRHSFGPDFTFYLDYRLVGEGVGEGGFEGFLRAPLRPNTWIKLNNQLINQNVHKDSSHSGSQVYKLRTTILSTVINMVELLTMIGKISTEPRESLINLN